jgi:predicted nucleic acid-binding protein
MRVPTLVVDTNVLSYILKGDTRAAAYAPHLDGHVGAISFTTVAELELWAEIASWGPARQEALASHLLRYVVHLPDLPDCRVWARLSASARSAGMPIGPSDARIATTAVIYDVPLLTHNPADFAGVPALQIITELEP